MESPHALADELTRRRAQYAFGSFSVYHFADRQQVEAYYQMMGYTGSRRLAKQYSRRRDGRGLPH